MTLVVHAVGDAGPRVVLVHGGPGAPGSLSELADALSATCRVLEPHQRCASDEPLTVARHVADLQEVLASRCDGEPPHVLGHSWGAMLALAHACEHPTAVRSLVLVGCGTFDEASREQMHAERDARMDASTRARLRELAEAPRTAETLDALGRLYFELDAHDATDFPARTYCDPRANRETWDDMLRLQAEGRYPAAFARITCPVLLVQGDRDPHPGRAIRASLEPALPQLESVELERCGHSPWLERHGRAPFLALLHAWLERRGG